jgi:YD repeat-containing protein
VVSYSYDGTGNRVQVLDPFGRATTYLYDGASRVTGSVNGFGERTTWFYDAASRIVSLTYANGAREENQYDAAGRLTRRVNVTAGGNILSAFTYQYDAGGQSIGALLQDGSVQTWSYDGVDQLVREQRSGASAYDITYEYDPVGNRVRRRRAGGITTYSYGREHDRKEFGWAAHELRLEFG